MAVKPEVVTSSGGPIHSSENRLLLPTLVCTEYIQTFPGEVPPRFTIHEIVKKFESTGSVANKKRNRKRTVLTEETLDEISASLERTPTKSNPKLAQQVGISQSSAHRVTNY